jgi:hypothetical protein
MDGNFPLPLLEITSGREFLKTMQQISEMEEKADNVVFEYLSRSCCRKGWGG